MLVSQSSMERARSRTTRSYLLDVLRRISKHPANPVAELTPRRRKDLLADDPMVSDIGTDIPSRTETIRQTA